MKVIAFIDGFNLYHSLAANPETKKYRWLDLKKLCHLFVKQSEILTDIYYFTALVKWDEGKATRHKEYIKALETTDIQVVHGNFKYVTRKCRECHTRYQTFEEKETDVNIALHLLKLAFQNEFDKFFLLTGDSDLIPALKMIRGNFPNKKSHIIIPINGRAWSLKNIADSSSKIKTKHLKSSLFPNTIHLQNGTISKPDKW